MKILAEKYEVIRKVGEGGFGDVYLGRHLELGSLYAIKLLREEISLDENFAERFKREAKILAQLVHKNSVTLRDFGRTPEGNLYMAMDYCDGETLEKRIQRKGFLSAQETLEIAISVLEVMVEAHHLGIIHRDIKPENIMIVEEEGNRRSVKVLDFGIAKLKESLGNHLTTLTQQGSIVGTPLYMSPEQAGGGELDHRSDLYSLGLVMYKMVSGRAPFEADSLDRLLRMQMTTLPRDFSVICPEIKISSDLEGLIFQAIQKEKSHRIQSASLFLERCKELLYSLKNGETTAASSRVLTQGSRSLSILNRKKKRLLLAILLVGVVPMVYYFSRPQKKIPLAKEKPKTTSPATPVKKPLVNLKRGESLYLEGKELLKKGELQKAYFKFYQAGKDFYSPEFERIFEELKVRLLSQRGKFSRTGSLRYPRGYLTATLLPTGKVLIGGGKDLFRCIQEMEIYDPLKKSFHLSKKLNTPRFCHTAVLLTDGKVLFTCGSDGRQNFNQAEVYDPFSDSLSILGSSKSALVDHTATLLVDGRVLLAGGRAMSELNGQNLFYYSSQCEIYDPKTNSFDWTGTMKVARCDHTATLLKDGGVLFTGGNIITIDQSRQMAVHSLPYAEIYNPQNNQFSLLPLMNRSRHNHTATLLPDGKVLLVGGYRGIVPQASAELYDPEREEFIPTGSLQYARGLHTAILLPQGKVLITGGQNNSGFVKTAEIYDPGTGKFYSTGSLNKVRTSKGVLLPQGEVLFPSGVLQNQIVDTSELYRSGFDFAPSLRPEISSLAGTSQFPQTFSFGERISIKGKNFQPVSLPLKDLRKGHYVSLMGLGSCGFNYQESTLSRYIILSIARWEDREIEVTLPLGKTNPPAYYMMFVVVQGMASEGKIIKLKMKNE